MKVLMINSVCGIRSTGRICTDLAVALDEQGYEVKIAYGREEVPKQFQKYAVRIGTDRDVKLHGLKARLFDGAGFGSKSATIKFIRWVKGYDPDVIHLHNIHGYYVNIEILFDYLRTCGKKIIWTLHDCWAFTGHCAHFDYANCNKWKTRCFSCTEISNYPKSLCDHSARNYDVKKKSFTGIENMIIVTPSKWLEILVRQSFLKEYSVKTIANGIDLNIFKPTIGSFRQMYHLENKKIVLGVASAWSAKKGVHDFKKLSNMLDDSYQIVLVGLTEKQCAELPKSILGMTRTNNATELAELYTTANVFANPTYEDTYPTVNIEAQACGTPVVTYQTGGSPETLLPNCGICVQRGDVYKFKNAIENMCSQGKAFVYDRSFFDKKICYKAYLSLYDNIWKGNAIGNADFEK